MVSEKSGENSKKKKDIMEDHLKRRGIVLKTVLCGGGRKPYQKK